MKLSFSTFFGSNYDQDLGYSLRENVGPDSNPNGIIAHIAGVANSRYNVFGKVRNPERAIDRILGNLDGKYLLEQIIR